MELSTKAYDETTVAAAVAGFKAASPSPVEALLASARLLQESLQTFRNTAIEFRAHVGDEKCRSFATEELNDIIYELQDSISPLLKTYNALLRDPDQSGRPLE